ncbi:uncharacterized protein LOC111267571 isoform X1 [Varroa jacobsoni]|uniref:uncharacterized protein LOC111267571 isoform X1 n=1 Tax=Varroa jacobsoni TaxID=62625 RepID=UPI000BF95F21|nr:uncharacterized protein LOC111267571 isoform X1 [Varroa jacobsoni]XP_022701597.1 uncharacterized protein LOC111267571 isoform X1 [Varroa jacobsoni]XP_022701598.1 uncharacterized protein LOC111267571 isoform X1 [Varroa jacobsoni]
MLPENFVEWPKGRGLGPLVLLLACLLPTISSDRPGEDPFGSIDDTTANNVCTFECIEDILQNKKFVNLIVTMSSQKLDDTDIHTYENLIPDEIKAFLHDQTQTKQFLESLNVTIEHAAHDAATRTRRVQETNTPRVMKTRVEAPKMDVTHIEETEEISSKLIHGQLEYPIVVNSQGQMIVTIHGCVYKIPEEIERIQLNDTTELKHLFVELKVLGFPVTQSAPNRISWTSTKITNADASVSTMTTSTGTQVVTINGNSFNLPAENQLLIKYLAEQPSMTFNVLEKLKALNGQLDINKLASTKRIVHETRPTEIKEEALGTSTEHTISTSHESSISSITPLNYTQMPIEVVDGSIQITAEGQCFRFPEDLPRMSQALTEQQLQVLFVTAQNEGFPVKFEDHQIIFDSDIIDKGPRVQIDRTTTADTAVTVIINQRKIALPAERDVLRKYIQEDQHVIYHLLETFRENGIEIDLATLEITLPQQSVASTTNGPYATSLLERRNDATEEYPVLGPEEAPNYNDQNQLSESHESAMPNGQPSLQSTRDGRIVIIFEGQRFTMPDELPKMNRVLDAEQVQLLVSSLSLLGVPVQMQSGQIIIVRKPSIGSINVQQLPGDQVLVHVDQSTYTLPQEADRLRLLWEQHPEYIYTIVLGYPRSVVGTPLLWNNYLTDHVLLTQELARTHYALTVPSREVASIFERIPSYELLTTLDGRLLIRVQGQVLQVPDDLPKLQTLVNPAMLMTIVTRLQQMGVPIQISNNRVVVTRETSTSYRIEVEVHTRGDRLISIVINMIGQRFELPRDADKFQQVIKTKPEITFQLFKLLAKYRIPMEFDQKSGMISFTFSDDEPSSEQSDHAVQYTIATENGKIIIRIGEKTFEIPRDLESLTRILNHEQLVTIVQELKSFGAPIELRGSRLVVTREQTTSYRISLQVTTMRGQPIKAIVTINQDRYQLPADEDRFEAFLAKEPSINYKIFQLLSSKNIPISYDNETRRVRIKFATPAQIQRQFRRSRRIVSSGSHTSSLSKSMSASVIYGHNNQNIIHG